MSDQFALTIVQPMGITDAMLTACTVPETDYAAYASGTTYAKGLRVIVVATHTIYESLQNTNVGNDPTLAASALWWIAVKPTNRWACFDASNSTQTAQASSMVYTLVPGVAVNALAVLNLTNATSLRVQMTSAAYGAVYDTTVNLYAMPRGPDWWSWFLGVRNAPTTARLLDLPSYPDATLVITLTGGSALAMGVLLLGQQVQFGYGVEYGAKVGIIDYSTKTTDTFGNVVIVPRAFAKRATFDLNLYTADVDPLNIALSSIRTIPCLYIGANAYESTIVFGFYKSFDILISYPERALCQFVIEGLT
jgi:uncharacterized protein (DUF2237 family)